MKELSARARALIDTVGDTDGPTKQDRARVHRSLFGAVASGVTLSGTAATAAAAVETKLAAGAALGAFGGKTVTMVALWLLGGGAAGVAVATPVVWYTDRSEPAVVTESARSTYSTSTPAAPSPAKIAAQPQPAAVTEATNPAPTNNARKPVSPPAKAAPAPDLAGEVALLQRAQRELSAGNASASLALLDDHGQRFPQGAMKAERLAARVFALCALGQVDQARAAAREFFSVSADSPLVPRVLSSCAGKPR